MATVTQIHAMTSSGHKVHPFFQKPHYHEATNIENLDEHNALETGVSRPGEPQHTPERLERVYDNALLPVQETPGLTPSAAIQHAPHVQQQGGNANQSGSILGFATATLTDADAHRAKRQRTASPPAADAVDGLRQYDIPQQGAESYPVTSAKLEPAHASAGEDRLIKDVPPRNEHARPDRILALNGLGGFASPEVNKSKKTKSEQAADDQSNTPRRRGRPRKSKIITISYTADPWSESRLGQKIDDILAGRWTFQIAIPPPTQDAKPIFTPAVNPDKPVHSFFSGKAPTKTEPKADATPTAVLLTPSTVRIGTTPRKIRPVQAFNRDGGQDDDTYKSNWPTSSRRPGGTIDAPWPSRAFCRVEPRQEAYKPTSATQNSLFPRRLKGKTALVDPEDNVVSRLRKNLLRNGQDVACNETMSKQVPVRTVETGADVRDKIQHVLSGKFSGHPATASLFDSVGKSVSAFDVGECEAQTWCQKYAPKNASQVLQPGKETAILSQWLKSLTIHAVEKSFKDDKPQSMPRTKRKKGPRAKNKELDDFIVDSDDDAEEDLRELSDDDVSIEQTQRTVVRHGGLLTEGSKSAPRCNNAILLSGPHGCGKSAAAFAVAKEHGFEVFEINAGGRRGGKDILDKVGDMALNHQVRKGTSTPFSSIHTSAAGSGDEARELSPPPDMSKQKSLNSFFSSAAPKAKAKAKPQAASKPQPKDKPAIQRAIAAVKQAATQKQSLILFEEVDILFDDDKLFWETVLDLAIQSKRPIIMTCTDESCVPLQSLSLQGLLRFRRPPLDLAVDHLLLIAAAEGHRLDRQAVEALYMERHQDLRASLMQLDFLCQMGLGDHRGGLGWYLQRWPPGSDLDSAGSKLRVISSNTFTTAAFKAPRLEEGLISGIEEFSERGIGSSSLVFDAFEACSSRDMNTSNLPDPLDVLARYSEASDTLSSTDLWQSSHATDTADTKYDRLDPTQPPCTEKTKHNFTVAYSFLDAQLCLDERHLGDNLALTAHSLLAKSLTGLESHVNQNDQPHKIDQATSQQQNLQLRRPHFSMAFDPISSPDTTSEGLVASVFDGTFAVVTEDLAPYVRCIVSFDVALEQRRARIDALLGGRANKRQRTTRAARSAVEGGQRATTRRDRYFPKLLDYGAVLKTGGRDWPQPGLESILAAEDELEASSRASTDPLASSQ